MPKRHGNSKFRKRERAEQARQRMEERELRSAEVQLNLLDYRPGRSQKERKKLYERREAAVS